MVITLIGLSGCGKSYLAKRLQKEQGFERFCCDDLIEAHLAGELESLGLSSIRGVAKWLGQPYEPQFDENQAKYLHYEEQVMKRILHHIAHEVDHRQQNVVIDTSGSVIYLADSLLQGIKDHSRLIYLAIPESEYEFMFQQYMAKPKPVIWNDTFAKHEDETNNAALARCYPNLIRERSARYARWADVTMIMAREHRDRTPVSRLLKMANAISK